MAKQVKCRVCGETVEKDAIALYKKLVSRKATRFLCMDCLANSLDTTVEELREKAREFRDDGCTLFQ